MHLKMLKRDKHAHTKEVEQALIPLRHLVYNCKVDRKKWSLEVMASLVIIYTVRKFQLNCDEVKHLNAIPGTMTQ